MIPAVAKKRPICQWVLAVTLSGLLNVLDGFHAPENVVYVMTTNRVEALDPALLRPGRIDYRLFMGEASESQRIDYIVDSFPKRPSPKPESSPRAANNVVAISTTHRTPTATNFEYITP
jgi:mitochondrial chaperone BCS1